jgi:branched-chain amino acid transport system ATP-binding protein
MDQASFSFSIKPLSAHTGAEIRGIEFAPIEFEVAGDLAYSEQRILEMGMALATDPAVLILDEPTAGMSRDETTYIVDLIRQVTEGRTLLVVEHDMSVVFTLCDQISVLVYGQIIASGKPEAVRANRQVQQAYLGEEVV